MGVRGWLVWAGAGAGAYATLMNVCAVLFSCGCRSWWTGAAAACNIHRAGVRHCPWCTLEPGLFWSLFAGFVAAQGIAVFALRRRAWWMQLGGAGAAYLASAAASALVLGIWSGYWR